MSDNVTYKPNWERLEDLGSGGQGQTIKVKNKNDGIVAAIKTLHKQNDPERRARMHREATALSTLSHPGIPQLIDSNTEFWKDDKYKLYIATEFIPGGTLNSNHFNNTTLENKIDFTKKIVRNSKLFP